MSNYSFKLINMKFTKGVELHPQTQQSSDLTSKLTSPQQLQAKQGPSSFSMVSLLGPWIENRGRKGCQSCLT